ncbi:hypothetical protein Fmac_031517 [Flemingia macrophylla]|uniref:DUF7870 domain-containing protein n=1 Tax=Flemingia macrophylla TaxID=520843 RepID=A0ABD1L2D7_9FABA
MALFLASFTLTCSTSTQQETITKLVTQRKLFGYVPEAKKAALQNLEDVLLEPPRAASGKSRVYLKRTRYLPDLMGDSLESYPRHVFIDVGPPEKDGGSGTDWFGKTYPTRNKNFEMYKIETMAEGGPQIEMSDWLRRNVREEEYVVMKAEAEAVEEMVRNKAIMLVDELFLDCKPQQGNMKRRNRRAYWECLALYGKLRDEGVTDTTPFDAAKDVFERHLVDVGELDDGYRKVIENQAEVSREQSSIQQLRLGGDYNLLFVENGKQALIR